MAKITVAKALKLKNELVGDINKLKALITSNNVYDNRNKARANTVEAHKTLGEKIVSLVKVKTAIAGANVAIHEAIYAKSEAAAMIEFLATVNTVDGIQDTGFGSDRTTTMVAQITSDVVTKQSAELQKKVSKLQDVLDEFNHKTLVDVPDDLV
jgi:hypothetical protein